MSSHFQQEFFFLGFEVRLDAATGTLTSDPFVVSHPWASFLVAGGPHETTCVEILEADSGRVIVRQSGRETENLEPYVADPNLTPGDWDARDFVGGTMASPPAQGSFTIWYSPTTRMVAAPP